MTEETPVQDGPSFADILTEFEQQQAPVPEGGIDGTVLSVTDDGVFVDIGRKTDGVLDVTPFRTPDGSFTILPGTKVKVTIKGTNEQGQLALTTLKVETPKDWTALQAAFDEKKTIAGRVEEVVKGGLRVDIGVRAFMPASRSGARDVPEMATLVGQDIECRITKLDTEKEDVVVDRRVVLEERDKEAKQKAFEAIEEGAVLQGTVRNLTDFGAFVDIGGVDGLLHVADISWTRIGKPADVLKQGDRVDVKVLKINRETRKISLGMKQLQPEPWAQAAEKVRVGERIKGKVMRLTDFGAFVELLPGVEGLIHISEMSWSKKVRKPSDILKAGEEVEAQVLQINPGEKRIALGLKQVLGDPWDEIAVKFAKDTVIESATVVSLQKFGAFVDLGDGVEGMIHVGDISNEKRIEDPKDVLQKGQAVRCVVLEVDREKRRLRLGMKQLEPTKADVWISEHAVGDTVTGRVADVRDGRANIDLGEGVSGMCRFETAPKGGGSSNLQKADVSSAAALLAAKFKQGIGAPETGPKLRTGETRGFKIVALDAAKKRIDLEIA
ncbi:MAG: 30S ribosomal protein S1 [Bryobacteraceae bacterium]|nr:30S ribosomal protein S1 [Bryobacteraceae bacterium]